MPLAVVLDFADEEEEQADEENGDEDACCSQRLQDNPPGLLRVTEQVVVSIDAAAAWGGRRRCHPLAFFNNLCKAVEKEKTQAVKSTVRVLSAVGRRGRTDLHPHLTGQGHHSAKDVGQWEQSRLIVWPWLSIKGKPSPSGGGNSPCTSSALCLMLCNVLGAWGAGRR